jgi:AmmeMemoRadiSam system protein B/AmmeMemoRadiSam system protein A
MDSKRRWWWIAALIAAAAVIAWAVIDQQGTPKAGNPRSAAATQPAQAVRQAAVAGLFYPADPNTLSAMIDDFLARANPPAVGHVRALICPHAGYQFSGPVAAFAYKLLAGHDIHTVIVLGPSHYAELKGAYVTPADAYITPLGTVPISSKAKALAKAKPFVAGREYRVYRPEWWRQSPQTLPAFGQDTPETWEHSVEAQIPFLQKVLKNFQLVPIVVGQTDPAELADAIDAQLDDDTLIVVSTDLSHYYPYDQARALDDRCVKAVCNLDIDQAENQEACGKVGVLALMHLAKRKGWQTKLLDYRNSGDTSGDKSRVVGYAAIAFYSPAAAATTEKTQVTDMSFSNQDRKFLLDLARKTIKQAVTAGTLPEVDQTNLSPQLTEPKGCFVTLTEGGRLRGCIGHILPEAPLVQAVIDCARSAALEDPRFMPVQAREVDKLEIEISVLTVPQPLAFSSWQDLLGKLQPNRDGVILKIGSRMATYLPQVWEQIPGKEEFMTSLAEKAGCRGDAWKTSPTEVLIYHVEAFKEGEP